LSTFNKTRKNEDKARKQLTLKYMEKRK
jgi:hypothetical protein